MSGHNAWKNWALGVILAGTVPAAMAASMEREPLIGSEGTVGLTDILSANSLGAGRLSLGLHGGYYLQSKTLTPPDPESGSDVYSFSGAVGWGLSPWIDGYAALYAFQTDEPESGNSSDLGTLAAGLKGTVPIPGASPVRLGLDLSVLGGIAGKTLNSNGYDGWAWAETRVESDVRVRLLQSLQFEGNGMAFRLHLNEGTAIAVGGDHGALLLQGAAAEFSPHPIVSLALEFASRTSFRKADGNDPMWLTPSLYLSGPHVQFHFGTQIALSGTRDEDQTRALEPYRVIAGLTTNIDFLAGRRRAAAEKARQDSLDQVALKARAAEAENLAGQLAKKSEADSLARLREQEAMRHRADSLAAAARKQGYDDSLRLAEAEKKLAEEKAARSDAEKQFLATGVLNLEALYFESGKAEISMNSKPYLNVIGKMLEKYTKLQLEVGGHTDNVGRIASNMALSQARAEAVRMYLIGVAPGLSGRINARGYGPSVPKADNRTSAGRQINRRVEISVLNKGALKDYE